MFTYVKNKLLNNKWMTISLLIGNILLIAIAACSPIYSEAVLQRLLQKNLQTQLEETDLYPGLVEFRGNYSTVGRGNADFSQIGALEEVANEFTDEIGQAILYRTDEYFMSDVKAYHEGETNRNAMGGFTMRVDALQNMNDHITMLAGTTPSGELGEGKMIEGIVSQTTMDTSELYLGEVLEFTGIKSADDEVYKIKIVGVFEASSDEDPYWCTNPNVTQHNVYVDFDLFKDKLVYSEEVKQNFNAAFFVTLDHTQFRGTDVEEIMEICQKYQGLTDEIFNKGMTTRFGETLNSYLTVANHLSTTLIVLQVPVFLLLAAFIFMVSGQMLTIDQSEISMIKSRGAARHQIMLIYLLQSVILVVIATVVAIPLGFLITQVIGSANAFLEFVQRKALSTRLTWKVFAYALGAGVISIGTQLIPVISYSKVGIVEAKRAKHKQSKPFWQKFFLDVLLLAISLYGLYSYNHQAAFLANSLQSGGSLDPLLYMCSSMFMLGCAMLFVRLFPLLIKLIFRIFKKVWSPGMYASFLRILRSRGNQNFIMIFLILTMALGLFSAETARTINSNAEELIRYNNGADIVLREPWSSQQLGDSNTSYVEPDFSKYERLEGYDSIAKVYVNSGFKASTSAAKISDVTVMGINTKEFGETAYFKDGLLNDHWFNYLNAMSQDTQGVLASTTFRDDLGLKVGDKITYGANGKSSINGVIYGFVDYWPSLTSVSASLDETDRYFIVANLSYLQNAWGVEPYQIWMKNTGSSSQYIYDFAEETGTGFLLFKDTNKDIIALKNDPVFQATNGILTVGFIVVLTLCSVGFLIYWILSIRSRQLQFGIFRAMGMTMREIIGMLINEQVWLSLMSIVAGAVVGKIASILYVPLIEMAYSSEQQMIPLQVVSESADAMKLYVVVGVVMVICMFILGRLIKKIKIAQALKLGED